MFHVINYYGILLSNFYPDQTYLLWKEEEYYENNIYLR